MSQDQTDNPSSAEQAALMHRILEAHLQDPHQGMSPGRLRVHVAIHAVIETQLQGDDPPETGRTLRRLQEAGMSRHQAMHLVGEVVADVVMGHLAEGSGYDAREYDRRLRALTPPAPEA